MIRVSNLKMSFGPHVLFDNVRFSISRGERAGLVGRNGSGKTTLLNLLCGRLQPDEGAISCPNDYSIGYIEQHPSFSASSVLIEGCLGLSPEQRDETWRVEKTLSGLGFSTRDMEKDPRKLSDGYQSRLQLAKLLIAEQDLLLLDEPTNYLDILSIRWLTQFLSSWQKELVLITHDRGFMDAVTTHTMAIYRKRIRKIRGSTEKMYELIAREEEIYERTRLNDERKRRESEVFINRFRAKARLAGLVQSRIRSLQKRETLEKLERIKSIEFSFHNASFPSRHLMVIKDLCFSYSGTRPYLITNLGFVLEKHDRIGVTGQNGMGKSTLLRLLSGELKPAHGSIKRHHALKAGYFGQSGIDSLNPHLTIEEELAGAGGWLSRKEIMDVCGAMLFGGELSQKKIAVLSGGEKSRVLLGKILLSPVNLLLLDEPTNHLDLESCDSLLAAIDSFEGAVIIVTHNEMFLNTLVNRLIVFQNDGVFLFEGSYSEFLESGGWEKGIHLRRLEYPSAHLAGRFISEKGAKGGARIPHHAAQQSERWDEVRGCFPGKQDGLPLEPLKQGVKKTRGPLDRRELRVQRAEIISARSKVLKPIEEGIKALEEEIETFEESLQSNNQRLIEASQSCRGETIAELSIGNHRLQTRLNELYLQLEELLKKHEGLAATFESQLSELES